MSDGTAMPMPNAVLYKAIEMPCASAAGAAGRRLRAEDLDHADHRADSPSSGERWRWAQRREEASS